MGSEWDRASRPILSLLLSRARKHTIAECFKWIAPDIEESDVVARGKCSLDPSLLPLVVGPGGVIHSNRALG